MATWRLRSRSLSSRFRAASLAALLVLILVSVLASGNPQPTNLAISSENQAPGQKEIAGGPGGQLMPLGAPDIPGGVVAPETFAGSGTSLVDGDAPLLPGNPFEAWTDLPPYLFASVLNTGDAPFWNLSPGINANGGEQGNDGAGGGFGLSFDLEGFPSAFAGFGPGAGPGGGTNGEKGPGGNGCLMTSGDDCLGQESLYFGPNTDALGAQTPSGLSSLAENSPSAVSEPASWALVAFAGMTLFVFRRRAIVRS
jgi:hypothetical protein